jgi:sulfate permease, SulP family
LAKATASPFSIRIQPWLPKLVTALRGYTRKTFTSDLIAGLTVGLVALPLAMAFAISSGMTPQAGIYTAIVAGFVCALLGGSMAQVSGPTGAFVVVVAGIVAKHGVDGLFICTLLAGLILIALGVTGLGTAVKYIPRPVVVGFTNGIAVVIASTQLRDFLGLQVAAVPGDFAGRLEVLGRALGTTSPSTAVLAGSCLVLIVLAKKFTPRVPGTIVALLVGSVAAFALQLPVESIATRFGAIPTGLPHLAVPAMHFNLLGPLLPSAITVAMLGAIESLMSAVVSDRMLNDQHNPNVELIGQGVANVVSPLIGGLPATGAIARTATNIRSGAKTPVASIIHAAVLVAILLFAAPLAGHIPLSVLAAILLVVAYNMGDWEEIPQIWRASKADRAVWLLTFALTVFADLTVAVQAGMILAALLYISRVTRTTSVTAVDAQYFEEGKDHLLIGRHIPEGVAIYQIHGPFLFGSTDKVKEVVGRVADLPPIVIVRLRNMTAIDTTGIQALEDLTEAIQSSGREVIFCGMRQQPEAMMRRAGFAEMVGEENLCPNAAAAVDRATDLLSRALHVSA